MWVYYSVPKGLPFGTGLINILREIVMEGIIFLIFLGSCAILGIYIGIAIQFGKIAESKGYDKTRWAIASFFFSAPTWIMIVALPNKIQHHELLSALHQISIQITGKSTQTSVKSNELPDL